jgi:hypothetical protein
MHDKRRNRTPDCRLWCSEVPTVKWIVLGPRDRLFDAGKVNIKQLLGFRPGR